MTIVVDGEICADLNALGRVALPDQASACCEAGLKRRDRCNVTIPEALRRLVRSRLRDPWFRSELRAVLAEGAVQALILEILAPRIDHAVGAALRGYLRRPAFRRLVAEVLAERPADPEG